MPRPTGDPGETRKIKVRTPWSPEIGIFRDYMKEDTPGLIEKCFEVDWSCMKQLKFKRSTPDEVKAVARRYYPMIMESYKV